MDPVFYRDADVTAAFGLDVAIASQRTAFEALASGRAQLAGKVALPNPGGDDVALSYLARLSSEHGAVSKLVDVHPANPQRGLAAISGTVLVLDAATGRPVAVLEAGALTELRTAAGSAVAADALARADADELAVLGSGVQARAHVRAISRVRALREVRIFSRSAERREQLAAELAAETGVDVRAAASAAEAVRQAGIVATCTLSAEPVVATDDLASGAAVLSVGSFEPRRCEVDGALARRATVVVDDPDTAFAHAGPIMRAAENGDLGAVLPLGDVLLGRAAGRTSPDDLVFYNSVGIAVQDAAAAHAVLGTL